MNGLDIGFNGFVDAASDGAVGSDAAGPFCAVNVVAYDGGSAAEGASEPDPPAATDISIGMAGSATWLGTRLRVSDVNSTQHPPDFTDRISS